MKKTFKGFSLFLLLFLFSSNSMAKTVLITAATGSFGQAISNAFADEGYHLVLAGRNKHKLEQLKKDIKRKHTSIHISLAIIDFSNVSNISKNLFSRNIDMLDGVVLIGPRPALPKTEIPTPEEWSRNFNHCFIAPVETLKQLTVKLKQGASIVIISGNSSVNYLPDYPNTNVIRLAWTGEVKNLMHHFAPKKIRVNAISPGPILTQHHIQKIQKEANDRNITYTQRMDQKTKTIPLQKYGSLADVSNLVTFLVSQKSAHLNGTNIPLDGGFSNSY